MAEDEQRRSARREQEVNNEDQPCIRGQLIISTKKDCFDLILFFLLSLKAMFFQRAKTQRQLAGAVLGRPFLLGRVHFSNDDEAGLNDFWCLSMFR